MDSAKEITPPQPIVKTPLLRRFGGIVSREYKIGRGFSRGEIEALDLTVKEARLLGLHVDDRRKTVYEENIERLRQWLRELKESGIKQIVVTTEIFVKRDLRKVFKGKTMSGRKGRGLLSVKYRYTHHYKWKRKKKERELKKRHEGKIHKGGD